MANQQRSKPVRKILVQEKFHREVSSSRGLGVFWHVRLGQLQHRDDLLATDRWKVGEELIDGVSLFQMVEQ